MKRVALATCVNLPEPDPDEALLLRALAGAGGFTQVASATRFIACQDITVQCTRKDENSGFNSTRGPRRHGVEALILRSAKGGSSISVLDILSGAQRNRAHPSSRGLPSAPSGAQSARAYHPGFASLTLGYFPSPLRG